MSDERLTFTDAEMKEIDENLSCPVKNNPEDAYDLVTRFCDMVCDEFQRDCPFQKLAQKLKFYEDAEEKGLLLRLPCKVGETVYAITSPVNLSNYEGDYEGEKPQIYECIVKSISFYDTPSEQVRLYVGDVFVAWYVRFCDFGKAVFFTKEEAEQKLAEMKGGGVDDKKTCKAHR